jgi:hypothetical protein
MARHRPIFNRRRSLTDRDGILRVPPVYRHSDQPAWNDASSASIEDGEAALS